MRAANRFANMEFHENMDANTTGKFKISRLLPSDRIFLVEGKPAKAEVIGRLTQAVCRGEQQLDASEVLAQVLKREEGISTTLDTGLSIPHARLEELENFKAALAVLPQGIEDPSGPHLEIKAMFLFLSPARQAFFQQHLQILASLAEVFKPDFIAELAACADAQAVAAKIAGE